MNFSFAPNLSDWLRKFILSKKFKEAQNKVVTDGRKSPVDNDVAPPNYETVANEEITEAPQIETIDNESTGTPVSQGTEVLEMVDFADFKTAMALTVKAQNAEATQDLVIRGELNNILTRKPFTARRLKALGDACPSLRQLAFEDVNLRSRRRKKISLGHFPSTLSLLSIRDSVLDIGSFLKSRHDFYNIRVLDLGGSLSAKGLTITWPSMVNLEELYLDGSRGFENLNFFQTVLVNCPALKVLDLEGTDVGLDVLELISKFAPQIETLYLGFTPIRDTDFYRMEDKNLKLRCLSTLCIADTAVSQYGLKAIRNVAPNLRDVTVNGFNVPAVKEDAQEIYLPLRVRRVCNVHIGAVFRNEGCGHFKQTHSLTA